MRSNIAATTIALCEDQTTRLSEAGTPPSTFSASLVTPQIRRIIVGGQDFAGWGG